MTSYREEIYNRIIAYYTLSEKIKTEILKLEGIDNSDKFDVLMPIVSKIREVADLLMEKYVILIKGDDNYIKDEIVNILDEFLEYIAVYKNKIYEIYNEKNN